MSEIGTLEWANATDGRLNIRQTIAFIRAQVGSQRTTLLTRPGSSAASCTAQEYSAPDGDTAREIIGYATERLPRPIVNHSWRVWLWARYFLDQSGATVDPDLLLAASLLHDAGMAYTDGRKVCFTLRSADVASDILTRAGFDDEAIEAVASAIVGHMNTKPPTGASTLTTVLHYATHLDVVGAGGHLIPVEVVADANGRYPREGFNGCFSSHFRREFLRSPLTRAGVSWAIGLPIAMRINPVGRIQNEVGDRGED